MLCYDDHDANSDDNDNEEEEEGLHRGSRHITSRPHGMKKGPNDDKTSFGL